jgi:DNA-binding CsgD family transcriptional regulator
VDQALRAVVVLALLSALILLVVLFRMRSKASVDLFVPFAGAVASLNGIGLGLLVGALPALTPAMKGAGSLALETVILLCKVGWAMAALIFVRRLVLPRKAKLPWRIPLIIGSFLGALLLAGWLDFLRGGSQSIIHQVNISTDYALFFGIIGGAFWTRSRVAVIPNPGVRRGINVLTGLIIGLFALLCLWWILGGGVRASYPQVRHVFTAGIFLYFNGSLAWWVMRHGRALLPREVILETPRTLSDAVATQYGISEREREIIAWIARGRSNREIAEGLFISIHTVKEHVANVFRKTGAKNRVQLTRLFMDRPDEPKRS